MNEAFNVVQSRIVGAMEALARARASGLGQGADDSVAIFSAETLLRRALRGLTDRFGSYERQPPPSLLMDSIILDEPEDAQAPSLPLQLDLPESGVVASDGPMKAGPPVVLDKPIRVAAVPGRGVEPDAVVARRSRPPLPLVTLAPLATLVPPGLLGDEPVVQRARASQAAR
jgi:hypothetical protein